MRYSSQKEIEKIIKRTVEEELQWATLENLLMQVDNYNDLFNASRALKRYNNLLKNYYNSKPEICYVALDEEQNDAIYVFSIVNGVFIFIVENEKNVVSFPIESRSTGLRLLNAIQYSSSGDATNIALSITSEMFVH